MVANILQIKWQGQSHYHATWESFETLRDAGHKLRKLDNYFKKAIDNDYWNRVSPSTTREDIEAMDLDRERDRDAIAEYVIAERVIAHRDEDAGRQYMVKCEYCWVVELRRC